MYNFDDDGISAAELGLFLAITDEMDEENEKGPGDPSPADTLKYDNEDLFDGLDDEE